MRTIHQQIAYVEQRLSRLQKRQKAIDKKADDHRKIVLGGVVIAACCDDLDPAELCGWLLHVRGLRTDDLATKMKERGLQHFDARAEARKKKATD